jgi:hypothetical protein
VCCSLSSFFPQDAKRRKIHPEGLPLDDPADLELPDQEQALKMVQRYVKMSALEDGSVSEVLVRKELYKRFHNVCGLDFQSGKVDCFKNAYRADNKATGNMRIFLR